MASARVLSVEELGEQLYTRSNIINRWPTQIRHTATQSHHHHQYMLDLPTASSHRRLQMLPDKPHAHHHVIVSLAPTHHPYSVYRDDVLIATGGITVLPPSPSPSPSAFPSAFPSPFLSPSPRHARSAFVQARAAAGIARIHIVYAERAHAVAEAYVRSEHSTPDANLVTSLVCTTTDVCVGCLVLPIGVFTVRLYVRFRDNIAARNAPFTPYGWDAARCHADLLVSWPVVLDVRDGVPPRYVGVVRIHHVDGIVDPVIDHTDARILEKNGVHYGVESKANAIRHGGWLTFVLTIAVTVVIVAALSGRDAAGEDDASGRAGRDGVADGGERRAGSGSVDRLRHIRGVPQ